MIDSNKNEYTITLYNNMTSIKEVYFNPDKLNLSCCYNHSNKHKKSEIYERKDLLKNFYNQEFVIENEHGDFRNFSDYQIIFKDKRIAEGLNFEVIQHCTNQINKKLNPKSSVLIGRIIIDKRLLRVLKEDKKVRLHYIYKDGKKVHIFSSEWINVQ